MFNTIGLFGPSEQKMFDKGLTIVRTKDGLELYPVNLSVQEFNGIIASIIKAGNTQ